MTKFLLSVAEAHKYARCKTYDSDGSDDEDDECTRRLDLANYSKRLYQQVAAKQLTRLREENRTDLTAVERDVIKYSVTQVAKNKRGIVTESQGKAAAQRARDLEANLRDKLAFTDQAKRTRDRLKPLNQKLRRRAAKTTAYVDDLIEFETDAGDTYMPLLDSFLNPVGVSSALQHADLYEAFTDPYAGGAAGSERRAIYRDVLRDSGSVYGADEDAAASIMASIEHNKPLDRHMLLIDAMPAVVTDRLGGAED